MKPTPKHPETSRFDERFDELAGLAYRVAFRIVGQREEARDIAQEALARAYSRWPSVEAKAPAWVGRVSTNLALDHLRNASRHRAAPRAGQIDPVALLAERADLVAALQRLPRRQRDVVVLRFLADLPEREVALALGLQTGTVKSHASRALTALRSTLNLDRLSDGDRPTKPIAPAFGAPAEIVLPQQGAL